MRSYELLNRYLENNKKRHQSFQHHRDKQIISDNIAGQKWFSTTEHSARLMIGQLVDKMRISEELCINMPDTKMLNVTADFGNFQLRTFYFQQANELINLQITVCGEGRRNYLAYYVRGRIVAIPTNIKSRIRIPELDGLNDIVGLDATIISPLLLLYLFLEITLYYDQTETIANMKLIDSHDGTINAFIEGD